MRGSVERIIDIQTPKYLTKDNVIERIAVRRNISNYICEKISETTDSYVIKNLLLKSALTAKTLENIVKNADDTINIGRVLQYDDLPQYLREHILLDGLTIFTDKSKDYASNIEYSQSTEYVLNFDTVLRSSILGGLQSRFICDWFKNRYECLN